MQQFRNTNGDNVAVDNDLLRFSAYIHSAGEKERYVLRPYQKEGNVCDDRAPMVEPKAKEDGVYYHIKGLKKSGYIRRVGSRKFGHWEVMK